jgi:hypothetical protein
VEIAPHCGSNIVFESLPSLFGIGAIAAIGVLMVRSFKFNRKSYDGYAKDHGGGASGGGWFPDASRSHDSGSSSGGGGGDGGD